MSSFKAGGDFPLLGCFKFRVLFRYRTMYATDPDSNMFSCRPYFTVVTAYIARLTELLHRLQNAFFVGVQEVRHTIPVGKSMRRIRYCIGCDPMPCTLEQTGGPELQHVPNIDQYLIIIHWCICPFFRRTNCGRSITWGPYLETADVLLEEKLQAANKSAAASRKKYIILHSP